MLLRTSKNHWTAALVAALCMLAAAPALYADGGQFDLLGPTIEVKVNRAGRTLPIAEVPTLAEGDRIWLHPVLDDHQAVRYLMVAAFLRGSINPPPEEWFTRAETWDKKVIDEGVYVTVPPGAQQAIVFLAPETGGDFSTLKNAVRGKPGAFVRASQDLNVASLDRARLDTYLAALKTADDPGKVKETSTMLGRSLALKVDQQCFDKASDQQAPCLMQNQDQMILDNGRSMTATSTLVNGPAGDLAFQAGSAPQANYGYYNSYVGAAMDIARILDNFHTAQYQYIPALSSDDDVQMKLRLNTPPSFHNPKSVLVVALPPIEEAPTPPLHPVDPKQALCMQKEPLVLPVEGSPAFFATQFPHGLTLHLAGAAGKSLDLPAKADAARGGFAVPMQALASSDLGGEVSATVHGYWGFASYTGPTFKLESTQAAHWTVAAGDTNALVVGREDELHLDSPSAACVDAIAFKDAHGKETKLEFKITKPDEITAKFLLKEAQPGPLTVEITQAGSHDPSTLTVASLSEAGKFESFSMHAGDTSGTLKGTRLDEVAKLTLMDATFLPGKLLRNGSADELTLEAAAKPGTGAKGGAESDSGTASKAGSGSGSGTGSGAGPGDHLTAQITLKDGRKLDVPSTITSARPQVAVLNKNVQLAASSQQQLPAARIQLASPDELPLDGKLTFALKSQIPPTFARGESIEIATEDGMASVTLSLSSGDLVLQDAKTAIGTLDPTKAFGASAFGLLQVRPILPDGATGDWQKLATLVRLPSVSGVSCPADTNAPCTLAGSGLYLIDAVATDQQFSHSTAVPDGFAGTTLDLPHVGAGPLYVKLRDNPSVVNTIVLDTANQARLPHPARPGAPTATRKVDTSATGLQGSSADAVRQVPVPAVKPASTAQPGQPDAAPSASPTQATGAPNNAPNPTPNAAPDTSGQPH